MNRISALALTGFLVLIGASPIAQAQDPPLAVFPDDDGGRDAALVDLNLVRTQLAGALNLEPPEIPATVALPASEAARVCGVPQQTLTSADGANKCEAQTTSLVLNMTVRRDVQTANQTLATPGAHSPSAIQ